MLAVDVNVLLYAVNSSSDQHVVARRTLLSMTGGSEPVTILPTVAWGFLRLVTDRRVLTRPLTPAAAASFLAALTAYPQVSVRDAGPSHWEDFLDLHAQHSPIGPDVTDVYLAACAMSLNATWISFDRGFARFSGLTWSQPA